MSLEILGGCSIQFPLKSLRFSLVTASSNSLNYAFKRNMHSAILMYQYSIMARFAPRKVPLCVLPKGYLFKNTVEVDVVENTLVRRLVVDELLLIKPHLNLAFCFFR